MLPPDPADVLDRLRESIQYSTGATIDYARCLQKDRLLREAKLTTSVVVAVAPQDLPLFGADLHREGSRIRLFNRMRNVHIAHPASHETQCRNCYRFGHSKPLCKDPSPTCPICAKPHPRSQHRCAKTSCPGQGNTNIVVDCCAATRLLCINCDEEHPATFPSCPTRTAIRDAARAQRDTAIPDAPSSPAPPPDPETPSRMSLNEVQNQPPAPATARQVPPREPAAPVPFAGFAGPTRPPLAAPLPFRALFSSSTRVVNWDEDPQDDEDVNTL